jgi:hypothetical protein
MPGDLESDVRACLTAQAARAVPPLRDLVGTAIRRVHRARRRRAAGGAVALVVVTTLATAGVAQLGGAPRSGPTLPSLVAEPTAPALEPDDLHSGGPDPTAAVQDRELAIAPTPLPVAVLTTTRLVTTEGPTIDLAEVGPVAAAYGVTKGWMVLGGTRDTTTSLWYVRAGGPEIKVLSDVDGLALSADGTRVAWRKGAGLYLAGVVDGRLRHEGQAAAPAGSTPVAFVGERVLLSRPRRTVTTAASTELGVWTPKQSATPVWRSAATGAYGTLPDGRTVVAKLVDQTTGGGKGCVGLLDAASGLAVQDRACNLPLTTGRGWVSPDGRWLVAAGRNARAVLVDLSGAFDGTPVARDAGPNPDGYAAWLDAQTLVHGGDGKKLIRLRLGKLAAGDVAGVEAIELSGLSEQELAQVVPRLSS